MPEVFNAAGYATMSTSSVQFTGRLTNLHQGVEVLHERASVSDLGHSSAKTARTFVDRLAPWLDHHRDTPFFVFLHVFDPHSPFEPYRPYDLLPRAASLGIGRNVVASSQAFDDSGTVVGIQPPGPVGEHHDFN